MAKSLSERIAARVKAKTPSRGAANRAAFLAVRDDVSASLGDGWPVKLVWETLHAEGKISFGYDAFLGYVQRLVLARRERGPVVSAPTSPAAASKKAKPRESAGGVGGFTFEAKPNKEDIL